MNIVVSCEFEATGLFGRDTSHPGTTYIDYVDTCSSKGCSAVICHAQELRGCLLLCDTLCAGASSWGASSWPSTVLTLTPATICRFAVSSPSIVLTRILANQNPQPFFHSCFSHKFYLIYPGLSVRATSSSQEFAGDLRDS